MTLWEGPFQHTDPLTFNIILQLQLEDTEELASTAKGKQREGTLSDADLALQMYTEDLKACDASMADRKMAQSIALAILRDAQLIHHEHIQEQQIARDRKLAATLEANVGAAPPPLTARPNTDQDDMNIWEDPEMLSKVAAIYMPELETSSPPPLTTDSESDEGTAAESSAWAARRKANDKPKLGHYVACGDDKDVFEVARVPCKHRHEYCRECLAELFRLSMTDETLFPPRCDGELIPLQHVSFFLTPALVKAFEAKFVELSTKNRTYCHDRACSTFIPADAILNDVATCPRCSRTTCITCKEPSHSGDCPEDVALQQLIGMANVEQWQRCSQCNRFIELNMGCNHMAYVIFLSARMTDDHS